MRERRDADQISLWPWGELVRESRTWQDLWILDIQQFLSTSGIWTQQVPLAAAALQARLDEWGMMVTPSNSDQIHQVVEYFDLTRGLFPGQFHGRSARPGFDVLPASSKPAEDKKPGLSPEIRQNLDAFCDRMIFASSRRGMVIPIVVDSEKSVDTARIPRSRIHTARRGCTRTD